MNYFVKLVFSFLLLMCIPSIIVGLDTCVKKGPCICAFPNGTGIDLQPAAKSTFFTAQMYKEEKEGKHLELSTYYYHPCYDALPSLNVSGLNTCNRNLSICRHVYTLDYTNASMYKMDDGVADYIGDTSDSNFSSYGESIVYTNGPSNTIVLLVCAKSDDKLQVNSLAEPNAIQLTFYSRSACLKALHLPDESGRSFGSTLLIIFFSLAIFYLVLGICTKKFLMGATGIEVIPNLAFWSDLPNLVKDGWAFTIAGFKLPARGAGPAMSPDPNSYDSI